MNHKKDLQTWSDEDLMSIYVKDDPMAFEILYHRHSPRVISFLTKKTKSEKFSQDLAQEVFLKLHRSRHLYNSILPFAPWLFSITRSVFLDAVKKRSLEDLTEAKDFDKIAAPLAPESLNLDLSVLPEIQQKVVSLRVYDEQTFEEIAKNLFTTPENARQIFSRGIKKLKSILGNREN